MERHNGGMTKCAGECGEESAMFSRLLRQSRHRTADPSLLVTAEPKPQGGRDDELGLGLER